MKQLYTVTILGALLSLCSCQNESANAEAQETNPGRKLLMESIDAHGGIEKWRSNGALQFRWTYHMSDLGKVVDSVQIVDPNTFAAVHSVPNSEVKFGRNDADGRYWIHPDSAEFGIPPQFWTLTPIYFIGIPFVFDDEGANLELLDETKSFEGKDYTQVKITYQASAGESPDDHYVLLIDPATKLVKGAYYTVTNPLVFKGGTPIEKFITLDNLTDIDGLLLAGGHKTYTMTDGKIEDQLRYTEISQVAFLERDKTDFSAPTGAKFLEPVPQKADSQ